MTDGARQVLVKEKIGDSGVAAAARGRLRRRAGRRLGGRRARAADRRVRRHPDPFGHQADGDLIARAERLRAVGRAGVGVDNVDVEAATAARDRGGQRAAVERDHGRRAHDGDAARARAQRAPGALLARGGAWERSKFSGVELYEKMLGDAWLRPHRPARGAAGARFGMQRGRLRRLRRRGALPRAGGGARDSLRRALRPADFITIHLPKTPETEDWLDAAAFAKMKDGVRVINVARGPLLVDEDLKAAIDSGKVAGAALDVFPEEPITDHPLFGYPNVVVTPHLGASTAEATDRAGYQAAEQVVAALTGGVVTSAVNMPGRRREDAEALGPFLRLAGEPGQDRRVAGGGHLGGRARGRVPGPRGRARHAAPHRPGAQGRARGPHRGAGQRRERPALAEERGIEVAETKQATRATSPTWCAWRSSAGEGSEHASWAPCSAAATGRTCSRRGARVSTSSSSSTWRSSATGSARHARPRRGRARRGRREHRVRGGGPAPRRRRRRRSGDHGGHRRRRPSRRRWWTLSSPATASSLAAR